MVSPEFAHELREEVPVWVHERLVEPAQAQALLERYAHVTAPTRGARAGDGASASAAFQGILYGTAGVLLGAASLVVLFVGAGADDAALPFIGAGLLYAAVGVALHFVPGVKRVLADTVLAAALVPFGAAAFPQDAAWTPLPGLLAAVAVLALRRNTGFLAVLSVVAFTVSAAAFSEKLLSGDMGLYWMPLQGLLLVGVVAAERYAHAVEDVREGPAGALAAVALCVSGIPVLAESMSLHSSELVELGVGAVAALLIVAGVLVRHRGVIVGAATVIAVDAVVFSFDVGGAVFGTLILVGLAALLVWQAEFLKGWFADAR